MFKKRMQAMTLVGILTASALLTGCGNSQEETKANDGGNANAENQSDNGNTEQESPLTYWVTLNPNVSANFTNLGDTELGKAWQEQTGVQVEFQHPASGQENEQFNLMIADGELPDIIEYGWLNSYSGGPEKAIEDGVIIPLNDIIDKYCPNLKKYLEEHPEIDKQVKTDDGNYFAFPFIRGDVGLCSTVGGYIRKDWLDELGLEVPETIDDWHEVLTAFKEQKNVESPLCFEWSFSGSNPFAFAFHVGTSGGNGFLLNDDGEIEYAAATDGFKEYLQTLNQWYQEGLLDKDFATLTSDQVTAKMVGDNAGASVGYAASGMQTLMMNAQKSNEEYLLVPTPVPTLKEGETPTYGFTSNQVEDVWAAISADCENVELAAKFLDYGYSEEGHNLFNYGIEGVSYNMEGDTAVYTSEILESPEGYSIGQALAKYTRASYNGPFVQDLNYLEQYLQLPTAKECPSTWAVEGAQSHNMPNITPTQKESKELSNILNELDTYVSEMKLKFILGTESFDNWDTYIQTLNSLQLDRALEIEKAALDRYNAR